jgi:hypothetical protein
MGKAVWQFNFTDIEKIEVKKTDSNQPGSDLTLITWVAGTFAYDLITIKSISALMHKMMAKFRSSLTEAGRINKRRIKCHQNTVHKFLVGLVI